MDCFECGSCSYVCPAAIPLVQYFRVAKSVLREAKGAG
jgi:electron transport complex protein RnfC